jgi:hypothetical protein
MLTLDPLRAIAATTLRCMSFRRLALFFAFTVLGSLVVASIGGASSTPPTPHVVPASSNAIEASVNHQRTLAGIASYTSFDSNIASGCAAHNIYAAMNGDDQPNPHGETPGKPGYTVGGASAAGQSELAGGSDYFNVYDGWNTFDPFQDAPFHWAGQLDPNNSTFWASDNNTRLCLGGSGAALALGTARVATYPGAGETLPYWALNAYGEYPTSPQQAAGLGDAWYGSNLIAWTDPKAGDPSFDTVQATLSGPGGAIQLDAVPARAGAWIFVPVQPLLAGTQYVFAGSASVSTDSSIAPVTWSTAFSTIAANPSAVNRRLNITHDTHLISIASEERFPLSMAGDICTTTLTYSSPASVAAFPTHSCYSTLGDFPMPKGGGSVVVRSSTKAFTSGGVNFPATTQSWKFTTPSLVLINSAPSNLSWASTARLHHSLKVVVHTAMANTQVQALLLRGRNVCGSSPVTTLRVAGNATLTLQLYAACPAGSGSLQVQYLTGATKQSGTATKVIRITR